MVDAVLNQVTNSPRNQSGVTVYHCGLGAAPFAALGFIRYHGMNAEQFLWAWIKSEFLIPKRLLFNPENIYYEAVKPCIENHEREERKRND